MDNLTNSHKWETIISVIDKLLDSDGVYKSLRIPIYILETSKVENWQWDSFRNIISVIKNVFMPLSSKKVKISGKKLGVIILFAHNTSSNINNLAPVANEILARKIKATIIKKSKSWRISFLPDLDPNEIIGAEDLFSIISFRERIIIFFNAIVRYFTLTWSFFKCNWQFTLKLLKCFGTLINEIYFSIMASRSFKDIALNNQIDAIISTSDFWPFENQLYYQGNKAGIPSFVIQHGITDFFWWPFTSNIYFVWGEMFKNELIKLGAPENRLKCTGMPASDSIFKSSKIAHFNNKTKNIKMLILSNKLRYIEDEAIIKLSKILIESISQSSDIEWSVKLHPIEDDKFYRNLGDEIFSKLYIHHNNVKLQEAVNDSDIVGTVYSTAGLEALFMGKPLIVFNISPRIFETAWWPRYGGGVYISSAKELLEYICQINSNEELWNNQIQKQKYFIKKCFSNEGSASKGVVDIVSESICQDAGNIRRIGR